MELPSSSSAINFISRSKSTGTQYAIPDYRCLEHDFIQTSVAANDAVKAKSKFVSVKKHSPNYIFDYPISMKDDEFGISFYQECSEAESVASDLISKKPTISTNSDAYISIQERMFRSEKSNQLTKFELEGTVSICCINSKILGSLFGKTLVKNDKSLLKSLVGNNVTKESTNLYRIETDFQNDLLINHDTLSPILIAKYHTIDSFRPMILKAKSSLAMVSDRCIRLAVNMVFNVQYFPFVLHNVKIITALASVVDKFPRTATACQDNIRSGIYDRSKQYASWDMETVDPRNVPSWEIHIDFMCSEGESFLCVPTVASLPISFKAEYNDVLLSGTEVNTLSQVAQISMQKKTFIEYRFL